MNNTEAEVTTRISINSRLLILSNVMRSCRFNFSNEKELQAGIEELLTQEGINFAREHQLPPVGRIDFYLPDDRIGIEVKVKGSPSDVLKQFHGYCGHADIDALLVVSSRTKLGNLPDVLNHKPVLGVSLWANGIA